MSRVKQPNVKLRGEKMNDQKTNHTLTESRLNAGLGCWFSDDDIQEQTTVVIQTKEGEMTVGVSLMIRNVEIVLEYSELKAAIEALDNDNDTAINESEEISKLREEINLWREFGMACYDAGFRKIMMPN